MALSPTWWSSAIFLDSPFLHWDCVPALPDRLVTCRRAGYESSFLSRSQRQRLRLRLLSHDGLRPLITGTGREWRLLISDEQHNPEYRRKRWFGSWEPSCKMVGSS